MSILIKLVNNEIKKAGGIAKYYEAVMLELYPQPFISRKNKSIGSYRFTTEYLKKNCDNKSLEQLASDLGMVKSEVTRRLREIGIKKKRFKAVHNRETCVIVNIENGVFYSTLYQAANALNYPQRSFWRGIKSKGYYKLLKVA
jgi:hypothetical protein